MQFTHTELKMIRKLRLQHEYWHSIRWITLVASVFLLTVVVWRVARGQVDLTTTIFFGVGLHGFVSSIDEWSGRPEIVLLLKLAEAQVAPEFLNGQGSQKPMPQGEHSTLQSELCDRINQVAKAAKLAYAFPELPCSFGGDSVIPNVAVFRWDRIPRTNSGRVANRFNLHPDWAIAILSPDQSQTKVLDNLLHCSEHGTELGWLIDPAEESILIVFADQRVQLLSGDRPLPILNGIPLPLTVEQVFSWLEL